MFILFKKFKKIFYENGNEYAVKFTVFLFENRSKKILFSDAFFPNL
jgi:deoxyadenosine/deoxycytidine kinase